MPDPRQRHRLATQPGGVEGVGGRAATQHLEGRQPHQADAPSQVDHAVAAAAQLAHDFVPLHGRRFGRRAADRRPDVRPRRRRRLLGEQGFVDLEMCAQLPGDVGEAPCVFPRRRALAAAAAQKDFMVDQVEDGVGVATQPRPAVQEDLGRKSLAPAPARALIVKQRLDRGAGAVGARRRNVEVIHDSASPIPAGWRRG
jgi:hypothetical protein